MIRHLVALRFKSGTPAATKQALYDAVVNDRAPPDSPGS